MSDGVIQSIVGIGLWLLAVTFWAGVLHNRVSKLEDSQGKLDELLKMQQDTRERVIRIEARLDAQQH